VNGSGMLDLAVLGLLKEGQMHGYQLRRQLGTHLGPLWQVSWGSLYPSLRRLARRGAVERVADNKTTAASGGRRKTVYRITPSGEKLFASLLEETGGLDDSEHFTLKLVFFRHLQPEKRVFLLERRRAFLQEKLAQFKANLRDYRERIDAYSVSLQRHDMATVQDDIEWLEELIVNEQRTGSPMGLTGTPPDPSR
jgi:DNA-binding PadR family transcriptional regulator